jgi:hypothetical protein
MATLLRNHWYELGLLAFAVRTTLPPAQKVVGPPAEIVGAAQVRELTMVVALEVSSAGVGSGSVAETLAEFVIVPLAVAVAEMAMFALPPFAIVPSAQVTVLLPLQVPCEGNALTKLVPAGSVSVTTALVAEIGPLFVTVTV